MNCIDAIEGSAKNVINNLHEIFLEDNLDDTEYIRNIRALIKGIDEFVRENKEITSDPRKLEKILYEFSREIWLSGIRKRLEKECGTDDSTTEKTENGEYYQYYFDYIYTHGEYPR